MSNRIRRYSEMLIRVDRYGKSYASHYPPASRGGELFAHVAAALARIDTQAAKQAGSREAAKQTTISKGLIRDRLIEEMEAINLTARAMVGKVPGLENKFRMPHNIGEQELLAVARLFAENGLAFKTEFIRRAMPESFVEDLNELIQEYAEHIADREQLANAKVSATVTRDDIVEEAVAAVRELNAIVRNTMRSDRAALAEWQSASHIERQPKHKKDTPPAKDALPATDAPPPESTD